MTTHVCGGTILSGGSGDETHRYCDRCGAFSYADDAPPNGTDKAANKAAWDNGDERSPEAQTHSPKPAAEQETHSIRGREHVVGEHDQCSDYQVCDTCHLTTGAGITTEYDAAYYAQRDPSVCPRCGGYMGVWVPLPEAQS